MYSVFKRIPLNSRRMVVKVLAENPLAFGFGIPGDEILFFLGGGGAENEMCSISRENHEPRASREGTT